MTAKAARRRLDPAERRGMILDEALRLFSERHYSTVTVRDIALMCEVNVGLLYHYFASKDDLVRCALAHALEHHALGYERQRATAADPRAEIQAWLDLLVALGPTTIGMVKLMSDYASTGIPDPDIDAMIAGFYARERSLLEEALRRGVASGQFREVNAANTARRISLMLDGIYYASATRRDDRIADDVRDLGEFIDLVVGIAP